MIFGSDSIRIKWEVDSVSKDITIPKNTYTHKYKFSKVQKKLRTDARTGKRKVIYKGSYQEFEVTVFDVSINDYLDFYSQLKNPDGNYLKVYPHFNNDVYYRCYSDKQLFKLYEDQLSQGTFTINFKAAEFSDNVLAPWILEDGIWNDEGVWMDTKQWNDGV